MKSKSYTLLSGEELIESELCEVIGWSWYIRFLIRENGRISVEIVMRKKPNEGVQSNHHEAYPTIHGIEIVKSKRMSEHVRLHQRLRREGKCNIPTAELRKISNKEYKKTKRYKNTQRDWNKDYNKYRKDKTRHLEFRETIGERIELVEEITVLETIHYYSY